MHDLTNALQSLQPIELIYIGISNGIELISSSATVTSVKPGSGKKSQFPCDNLFNVSNVAPTYGQGCTIKINHAILSMPFHVCHQLVCPNGCIATLVAFIWLLSTVSFIMSPQFACFRGCIITLFAFIWLFATVCFQMSPQFACFRGCIVTLVAFV